VKPTPKLIALVFIGGALGTWSRWLFAESFTTLDMLILVNLLGSAFLGFVNTQKSFDTDAHKAFWAVGFCGGFTTMSGVALWNYSMFSGFSVAMVLLMMVCGVIAYQVPGNIKNALANKNARAKWNR
jgi:fluoride ion exporter CrcB/FEX